MKNNKEGLGRRNLTKQEQAFICDNIEALSDCLHIIRDCGDEIDNEIKDCYLNGLSNKYLRQLFEEMDDLELKILGL